MRIRRLATGFTVLALAVLPAFAQSVTGTIAGMVKDPHGALVPGAKVPVRNPGTNAETITATNDDGQFKFANLVSGQYVLEVTASGFRKAVLAPQVVGTGDVLREDVTLE